MGFRLLEPHEVEAVMSYAKALHDGTAEKPEEISEIDAELAEAIRQAVIFKATLRQTDHGLVMEVVRLMLEKDTAWVEAAMDHLPSRAVH